MTVLSRMFGVELEGYVSRRMIGESVDGWAGVYDGSLSDKGGDDDNDEVECEYCDSDGDRWNNDSSSYYTCDMCGGSHWVRNPNRHSADRMYALEMVSPKLTDTASIESVFRSLHDENWETDKDCGLHVHVNAGDIDPNGVRRVLHMMVAVEPLFYGMSSRERCNTHYCKFLIELPSRRILEHTGDLSKQELADYLYGRGQVDANRSVGKYHNERYHGLNLHAYFYHGTLEFRYFDGAESAEDTIKRTELCVRLVDFASTATDEQVAVVVEKLLSEESYHDRFDVLKEVLGIEFSIDLQSDASYSESKRYCERLVGYARRSQVSA